MTKKKRRLRLCAAALLLAALAVIYALVLRADFNGQDTSEEEEELTVLAVEREDIRSSQFENSAGTLAFSYDGETWSSVDDPDFPLDQDAVSALFNRLNPLSAVRDLGEMGEEDLEAYGLEAPAVTISLTLEDGEELSVYLGNEASDGNLYFMISESSRVYTGDSYLETAFECELSDFEEEEEEAEETEEESESEAEAEAEEPEESAATEETGADEGE